MMSSATENSVTPSSPSMPTSETTTIAAIPQESAWQLPDMAYHQPKCDTVKDDDLLKAVISKWPADKNGDVNIPYTFSNLPYFLQPYEGSIDFYKNYGLHPVPSSGDEPYINNVKTNIRLGLNAWENASNGKLHFYEDKNLSLQKPGLSFYLADEDTLLKQQIVAFTQMTLDDKGYLNHAAITFPSAAKFWDLNANTPQKSADNINTITHELGHALGAEHFHDYPEIRREIEKTPDGVYCSVMPYQFLIENEINKGTDHCENPPFAAIPGPLDERFIQLNYANNVPPKRDLQDYYVRQNIKNALVGGSLVTGAYQGLHSFAANLSFQPDKKTFSDTITNLITDGAFVAGMTFIHSPLRSIGTFVLGAGMKYIPATFTDKIPKPIMAVINNPYTSMIYDLGTLGWAAYQGEPIAPMIATRLAGTVGCTVGSYLGDAVGKVNAYVTNKVGQGILALLPSHEESEKKNEEEKVQTPIANKESLKAGGLFTFFNKNNTNSEKIEEPEVAVDLQVSKKMS